MKTHEMTDAEFERYLKRHDMRGLAAAKAASNRRHAMAAFTAANEKATIRFLTPAGSVHGAAYTTSGTLRQWFVKRSISLSKPWEIASGAGRHWTGFMDLDDVRSFIHCRDVEDRDEAARFAALPKPVLPNQGRFGEDVDRGDTADAENECLRCGRRIPERMAGSGYCSYKCERDQQEADWQSAELESELQDEDPNAENTITLEQPSLTRDNLR